MSNWYTVNTPDFQATVNRQANQVAYADRLTPEQAVEYVKEHLDTAPDALRPIIEFGLAECHRDILLRKGGIGEGWYTMSPAGPSARAELSAFGTVDRWGYFYFNDLDKKQALAWMKQYKAQPCVTRRNGSGYTADLGPLGYVIVEKGLVRYTLPSHTALQPFFLPDHKIPAGAFKAA